jgi:anti-sigma B factor antagonist
MRLFHEVPPAADNRLSPPPPLRTTTRIGLGGSPVIEVYGELDIVTADRLAGIIETVMDRHGATVTVDLAGVPFCDLIGLEALARAADRARVLYGALTLTNPPSSLRRLLQVTGLTRKFTPSPDDPAPLRGREFH